MIPIRGVTVCVGYDDLLTITLPRNFRHLTECWVVTSPDDRKTIDVANDLGATIFTTDAFTRYGARFNKGLAIEECFKVMGRQGWIAVIDADTLLPDVLRGMEKVEPGKLWSAPRRIVDNPKQWNPSLDWRHCPLTRDIVFPGYFHLFHALDTALLPLPWYDVTFKHAGGGDGYFQSRWPKSHKIRLPFEVLHLGPRDANWFGRTTARADGRQPEGDVSRRRQEMSEFRASERRKRQQRITEGRTKSCIWLPDDYPERVVVPGEEPRQWVYGRDE